nr:hypothetical protein GCM10020185_15000 [Pseudomonas brassicacearum subsp. brassicacearum]
MTASTRTLSATALILALGSAPEHDSRLDRPRSRRQHGKKMLRRCPQRQERLRRRCRHHLRRYIKKMDYQGNSWKSVPKGTCTTMESKTSPTGFGQLEAFKAKS